LLPQVEGGKKKRELLGAMKKRTGGIGWAKRPLVSSDRREKKPFVIWGAGGEPTIDIMKVKMPSQKYIHREQGFSEGCVVRFKGNSRKRPCRYSSGKKEVGGVTNKKVIPLGEHAWCLGKMGRKERKIAKADTSSKSEKKKPEDTKIGGKGLVLTGMFPVGCGIEVFK